MTIMANGRWAILMGLASVLWLGCGDSASSDGNGGGGGGDEPAGEKCFSPGGSSVCLCETMVQGIRSCGQDGYWTECTCRAPLDPNMCLEGDMFRCPACPGEAEGKIVVCKPGGTLECKCDTDGGATDGAVIEPVDAGHDSGSASGADAG